jgi:hypothetical protein
MKINATKGILISCINKKCILKDICLRYEIKETYLYEEFFFDNEDPNFECEYFTRKKER